MKDCLFRAMMVAAVIPAIGVAQHNTPIAGDGHPDLSGTWVGSGGLATSLKRVVDGKTVISRPDQSRPPRAVSALPSAPAPSYKSEFQRKVKDLSDHESKVDPVFYCGKPGVPRVGAPSRSPSWSDPECSTRSALTAIGAAGSTMIFSNVVSE